MPRRPKRPPDVLFAPVLFSEAMRRIDRVLRLVAVKDVTLTFIGESGSGKEILARRAHELSHRRHGPFIPINCAAIPEALFESELFGHERGAFTGANQRAYGKIEAAQGGTLFLDEIGDMPVSMQAKLLRFLENRRFMRVGGSAKLDADVRLMVATLRPLDVEAKAGRFRADLYYRIQGITLIVPPLRERRPDIPRLLQQVVAQLAAQHGVEPPRLTRQARALLMHYDWPGNVRELKNVVQTLCLLRSGRRVQPRDLPTALQESAPSRDVARDTDAGASLDLTLQLDRPLEALVSEIVQAALALERGNRARAASRLGISVRTVQRLLASGRVGAGPRIDS